MNKQIYLLAFLACIVSSFALSKDYEDTPNCFQARIAEGRLFEGKIREVIEKFRKLIRDGNPSLGLPPGDPLDVENFNLSANNKWINLNSTWTAKSEGASKFLVTKLSLSLIGLNLKFTFTLPKVTASGDYDLDLKSPLISQGLYGKGKFDVRSEGLVLKVKAKLGTKSSNGKTVIQIKKLEVDPSLKDFYLDLTGFMHDEELSQIISDTLTNNLAALLPSKKPTINEAISKFLPVINQMLSNKGNTFGIVPVKC